ncbi:MAG: hypothetical protein F6J93_14415 [Oscillatoria sp. SIO1A7]|nr:hypothetical protein [Oscillatoria sp. SIO1A7]
MDKVFICCSFIQKWYKSETYFHLCFIPSLHPTPHTPHPTPHTPHPTPYTPHPTPHHLLLMSKINLARISPLAVFLNGLLGVPIAQSSVPLPSAWIFFLAITAGCTLLYAFTLWLPGYLAPSWLLFASLLPVAASAAFYFPIALGEAIAFGKIAFYLCLILFFLGTLLPTLLLVASRWRLWRMPPKRGKQALLALVRAEISARKQQSLLAVAPSSREPSSGEPKRLWDVEVKIGKQPSQKLGQVEKILEYCAEYSAIDSAIDSAGNFAGYSAGQELSGTVLVLGGRGGGKTTTLLDLAEDLCDRAELNPSNRVPVLLDLASWKPNQPLERWLLRSVRSKYDADIEIGEIFPVLDGIDELSLKRQEQCHKAINRFSRDFESQLMIVCSSFDRYKHCKTRLRLRLAIGLQSIKEDRIKDYLLAAKSRELWETIEDNSDLLPVAKVPLFLNAIALADEEILIQAWKRLKDRKSRERYVLNAWVRRQLARRSSRRWYPPGREPSSKKTRYWLSWLAKTMHRRSLREISLESLPPVTWQLTPKQSSYTLAIVLLLALAYSLCFGLLYGFNTGVIYGIVFVGVSLVSGTAIALGRRTLDSRSLGNQTIWLSGVSTIAFCLMGLLSFALVGGIGSNTRADLLLELPKLAKFILPILGLLAGQVAAIPGIQHLILHFILWRQGHIPWNYARFLQYAADKTFLQKVGKRCRFPNYLVQEHFAHIFPE